MDELKSLRKISRREGWRLRRISLDRIYYMADEHGYAVTALMTRNQTMIWLARQQDRRLTKELREFMMGKAIKRHARKQVSDVKRNG